MKEACFIVGDVEGFDDKFFHLQKTAQETAESIALTIFVGDIVGKGVGNIALLRWCFENQERIKMILGNKDFLIQQIIGGKKSEIQWANALASKLDKKENTALRDFFIGAFVRYFVSDTFIVSHARLLDGKTVHKHTPKQLNGVNRSNRGQRYYRDKNGRILFHGHHSREGYTLQRDKTERIIRVCVDSGAGKGKKTPLTGALIGQKQELIRVIDTNGTHEKIKI